MHTLFSRWRLPVMLIIFVFFVTACFQGDQDDTDLGVDAAINVTATTAPTETPDATVTPTATATTLDLPVVERPSETITATDESVTAVAQAGNTTPTATPVTDDFSLTATERIRQITATIYAQDTATAIDQGIGQSTPTPFSTPTATQNPFVTPTSQGFQPPTGGTGADCVHQVRAGQTLWRLSYWYGVPVRTLAARNNITNIQLINVGQRITIPNCGTTGFTPPPTFTPTAAPQTGFNPQPGSGGQQPVNPPAGNVNYLQHTVQQYETLFQISMQYNVPVQQIAAANGITNYEYIRMSDVLQIPVSTGTTQQNSFQNTQQNTQPQQNQQQPLPTATWTPLAPGVGS